LTEKREKMNKKKAIIIAICVVVIAIIAVVIVMVMHNGKPYSSYNLNDYIKVANYKGLEVEKYEVDVTTKKINSEIKSRLKAAAKTKEVKKGTVKDGDTIVITYEGKINGKTFENGSAKGANLTIGSDQFIDGFEDGLIGVKVGDTKTLKLKFPSDYKTADVAGKKVVFTVTVDAKQVTETPTLDTDFVKNNSDVETIAAYKKTVKKDLEEKEKEDGIQTQKDYLWNEVVENSTVKKDKDGNEKYPQDEIDRVKEETTQTYKNYAKQYNLEFSDFLEQQMKMDENTFNTQVKEYAKTIVKEDEVLYSIADKENIEVTKKEYDNYITSTLKQYGYTEASYKKSNGQSYEDSVGKDQIKREIYMNKVKSVLLKDAKVVSKLSTSK